MINRKSTKKKKKKDTIETTTSTNPNLSIMSQYHETQGIDIFNTSTMNAIVYRLSLQPNTDTTF